MKKIIFIICVIGLVGCTSNAYKQGQEMGLQLCKLHSEDAFNNFPKVISDYNAVEDSISAIAINDLSDLTKGVFDVTKNCNDTILIASSVLVSSPSGYGLSFARECAQDILDNKTIAATIANKLDIIRYLYNKSEEENSNDEFNKAFQSYVDSLSVDKQMLIYSKISTPTELANAIADDMIKGVDADKSKKQIDAIKKIYLDKSEENIKFFETLNKRFSPLKQQETNTTQDK